MYVQRPSTSKDASSSRNDALAQAGALESPSEGANLCVRRTIRLRPTDGLTFGANVEVLMRQSAFRYRDGWNYRTCR